MSLEFDHTPTTWAWRHSYHLNSRILMLLIIHRGQTYSEKSMIKYMLVNKDILTWVEPGVRLVGSTTAGQSKARFENSKKKYQTHNPTLWLWWMEFFSINEMCSTSSSWIMMIISNNLKLVNACRVYLVEVCPTCCSITFVIKINGVVCVQLTHFSSGDWKDIFIAHVIIIIKSEVSTFPIVIIFFRGRVSEMFGTSFSATYCIYIPGKLGFCSHHYCTVYDQCK